MAGYADGGRQARRRGCRDEAAHDALVARVFHDNQNYNDDPAVFEAVYEELLHLLEEGGKA